MKYLKNFILPTDGEEGEWLYKHEPRTCYDSVYPFNFFTIYKDLHKVEFDDITILCGSNGSGKTTLLNVISEKLQLRRNSQFNNTYFFRPFIKLCRYELNVLESAQELNFSHNSCIITSDDVFNHIIEVRDRNDKLDFKRELMFKEKVKGLACPRSIDFNSAESLNEYRDYNLNKRLSASQYVRKNLGVDERTYSNGENAFKYFTDSIQAGGLYILDEPENSMSVEMQMNLVKYIIGMAKFYECQFIISTHSPFILSIPNARIYDMDKLPVSTCKWSEISNIRAIFDFFMEHKDEFQ